MIDFIKSILINQTAMWWIMAVIVFLLSQLLKLPIKHFTKILPETQRKKVNSIILLIPFILGVTFMYFYDVIVLPKFEQSVDFQLMSGFILGGQSIALYGVFERFLGKRIDNPYETEEGKLLLEKVNKAVEDNIVTKSEAKDILLGKHKDKVDNILSKDEQEQIKNLINPKGE